MEIVAFFLQFVVIKDVLNLLVDCGYVDFVQLAELCLCTPSTSQTKFRVDGVQEIVLIAFSIMAYSPV